MEQLHCDWPTHLGWLDWLEWWPFCRSWWTHGRWCGDHNTHLGPFDAKVVGMGATGDWNIDPKNHQLLDRLNWSSSNWPLALDVTGWYLLFLHVKAHSSQPCNDFVDACAKYSLKRGICGGDGIPSWQPLFRRDCVIKTRCAEKKHVCFMICI